MARKANVIKACDEAFSVWIRKKEADKWGFVNCATCGIRERWEESTCGHLYPRANFCTRWEEKNALPQCWFCQGRNNGEREKMAEAIDKKFGCGTAEEMRITSYKVCPYDEETLKALTKKFRSQAS